MAAATGHTQDEIGWCFVEQYYTTLSREPGQLHLYYNKHSRFCFGNEAEKVTVAVGPEQIKAHIQNLAFRRCKVRVLNVDAQGSFDNILVIVIGEISNDGQPSRKFVQTFVLAQQPNGYYVLNDVFRYLKEDDDEDVAEDQAVAQAPEKPEPAKQEVVSAAVADEPTVTAVDTAGQPAQSEMAKPVNESAQTAPQPSAEGQDADANATQKVPEATAETLSAPGAVEAVDEKLAHQQEQETEQATATQQDTSDREKEGDKPTNIVAQVAADGEAKEDAPLPEEPATVGLKEPEHSPVAADAPPAAEPEPQQSAESVTAVPARVSAATASPAPAPATTAAPKTPMSWANVASSKTANATMPAVPAVPSVPAGQTPAKVVTTPAKKAAPVTPKADKPKAAGTTGAAAATPGANGSASRPPAPASASSNSGEWQTVSSGNEHHVRRQSTRGGAAGGAGRGGSHGHSHTSSNAASGGSGPSTGSSGLGTTMDPETITQAYVKNVNEKVDASLLKAVLSKFGPLKDFDVNRAKNCAFVEFSTPAAYQAAAAASPHLIGTEHITVVPRRFRGAMDGVPNGRPRSDRGGRDGGRGGMRYSKDGRGGKRLNA
ncbi:hypothetical protein KEM52_005008 [Ascosphaera acerosa]|nr:hypothetical protein KEM52_005008 [Ascosphaera acerosa]